LAHIILIDTNDMPESYLSSHEPFESKWSQWHLKYFPVKSELCHCLVELDTNNKNG